MIENVSGMSGTLGVDRAAKSPPDGYTLAVISSTAASIGPFAIAKMPFDPEPGPRALITTLVRVPEVIAMHPCGAGEHAGGTGRLRQSQSPARINYGSAGSRAASRISRASF